MRLLTKKKTKIGKREKKNQKALKLILKVKKKILNRRMIFASEFFQY